MKGLKPFLPVSLLLLVGCTANSVAGARPAQAPLKVTQTYLVKPDLLAIRIDAGQRIPGKQVPYQPQIGDKMQQPRPAADDWVTRLGQPLGALVGKSRNILYTFDQMTGAKLDPQWADRTGSYQLRSSDDQRYASTTAPIAVFRKSKPTDMVRVGQWNFEFPMAHTLYLKLPAPLQPHKTYQIQFPGGGVEAASFRYQPNVTRSEAVHVSHIGFHPNDAAKVAFLSMWMGSGGKVDYADGLKFSVVNEKTQEVAYSGKTTFFKGSTQPEDPEGRNYTLTDVHQLDFTAVKTPGTYRVCVEQVGCSLSFPIATDVWRSAFYLSVRGLYHQRSGIELGPPYTSFKRPRSFHPDDGVEVFAATTPITEVGEGIGKTDFSKVLGKSRTAEKIRAWGGYYDAGDWDRRIQHVEVSRLILELQELAPNYFTQVNLNLPESKNPLPDLIDEALWNIDLYRRMQTAEGGIRGGIQSESDPRIGEGSWQESMTVLAYAPDAWSSYLYAGVAARAAYLLKSIDAKRSQQYQDSARRAIAYADRQSADAGRWQVRDARNLAALEMYRLTQDQKWHQIFRQTTIFNDRTQPPYEWDKHNQRDAGFLYARLPGNLVDRSLQQHITQALIQEADSVMALTETTAFRWSKPHPYEPVGWGGGLGAPKAVSIVRAHHLTQNPKYLRATVLASQFSLGANPDNMTYTTGLGHRSPQHPLVLDQRVSRQAPPPGITVYGPYDPIRYGEVWTVDLYKGVTYPSPKAWPAVESYTDIFLFPMVTEFTVMQTIAPTAYTWGYLAAQLDPNARTTY